MVQIDWIVLSIYIIYIYNLDTIRLKWTRYTLQVSCASEGSVTITVGENIVVCSSAGQKVSL